MLDRSGFSIRFLPWPPRPPPVAASGGEDDDDDFEARLAGLKLAKGETPYGEGKKRGAAGAAAEGERKKKTAASSSKKEYDFTGAWVCQRRYAC